MDATAAAARPPRAGPLRALLDPIQRAALVADVAHGRDLARRAAALLAVTVSGSAIYGAVLGSWRGPSLAVYAAVKLPAVLLTTAALTMAFNALLARVLGARFRLAQTAVLTFLAMAIASAILASLAPAALLFTLDAAPGSRLAHNGLFLLHTALVGGSGLAGTLALRRQLVALCPSRAIAVRVHAAWVLAFALVGGEVAWALRPFVGSIYEPVAFLRDDALEGNVYEFIVTDILPYLARSGQE